MPGYDYLLGEIDKQGGSVSFPKKAKSGGDNEVLMRARKAFMQRAPAGEYETLTDPKDSERFLIRKTKKTT